MIFRVSMWVTAILTVAATLLYQLHPVFKRNSLKAKMLCSFLFVLTGFLASLAYGIKTDYSVLMSAALVLGLIGDFFLDWKKHDTFLVGTLFFSLGHLVYIYVFTRICLPPLNNCALTAVLLYIVVIIAAIAQIKTDKIKFKGKYKIMLLYSLVLISSFVFSTLRGIESVSDGKAAFGIMLMVSGAMFMVSDAFLASKLFGVSRAKNPDFFVAAAYFPAQTLFALSIYFQ